MSISKTPISSDARFSIIIVNYKSQQYLAKCIASIQSAFKGVEIEIIIVNNDREEKLIELENDYPSIKIIHTQKNIGFGRAHNLGAAEAKGRYLLLINPDTEVIFAEPESIFEKMRKQPELGIIGLKIVNEKHERQPWTVGFREVDLYDLIQNNLNLLKRVNKKQSVFWVSGAAFIIEKVLFNQLGGFDENFFMYFEDVDLCKRARGAGRKIESSDAVVVRHVEGGSWKDKTKQKHFFYASQDYYFKKHFKGWTPWVVRTLRKIVI
ncbi:MAG: glycosyltransferase family 2 protein [Parcubacteria group bacterium]|jgi:hypothetical protein